MGGMIRQFVDSSTGTGAIVVGGSGVEFDDIIGAPRQEAARTPSPALERPVAATPAFTRRRGGRGPALAAISALAVAGIAIAGGIVVATHLAGQHAVAAVDTVLAADKAAPATVPVSPTTAFGSASALDDDLVVTISDPIAFSPSPKAIGADGGVDVVSTVTITNHGSGPVDPGLAFVPSGTAATRIFDRAQGIRINGTASLGVDRTITYRIAFAVDDVAKLSLRVTGAAGDTLVYGP